LLGLRDQVEHRRLVVGAGRHDGWEDDEYQRHKRPMNREGDGGFMIVAPDRRRLTGYSPARLSQVISTSLFCSGPACFAPPSRSVPRPSLRRDQPVSISW